MSACIIWILDAPNSSFVPKIFTGCGSLEQVSKLLLPDGTFPSSVGAALLRVTGLLVF